MPSAIELLARREAAIAEEARVAAVRRAQMEKDLEELRVLARREEEQLEAERLERERVAEEERRLEEERQRAEELRAAAEEEERKRLRALEEARALLDQCEPITKSANEEFDEALAEKEEMERRACWYCRVKMNVLCVRST
jgi:dTMP kinase